MSLYFSVDFRSGSTIDTCGGKTATATGVQFKNTEKGLSLQTGLNQYLQYSGQILPNNSFSVVIWARLKYTHVVGTDRGVTISASSSGAASSTLMCSYSTGAIFSLGSNNYRTFTYTLDKKYHCFIFTIPGNSQTDMNNAQLFIDSVLKSTGSTDVTGAQAARTGFVYIGGGNTTTSNNMLSRIKVYDHVLSTAEIANEQIEFENSKPYVNNPFKNVTLPNGNQLVLHETWKGYGVNTAPKNWIKGTGVYTVQQLTADSGIKKKGEFVLKCNTAGTIAIPSNVAYGTWEFDWYKGGENTAPDFIFMSKSVNPPTTTYDDHLYWFRISINEQVVLLRSGATLLSTSNSYITSNTWYKLRTMRYPSYHITYPNYFFVYIKGGTFTNWTLVSVIGGSGTNPVQNAVFTTSKWFVLDIDANDLIGDVKIFNNVI